MSYPKHAYPNARAFKQQKRRDLRALRKAVNDFRMGCAYVPPSDCAFNDIHEAVQRLERSMSVKEWGR